MMRGSFRFRLLLAAVLPTLLLAAVLAAIWLHWTQTVLESSLRQRVEAVARQLATASEFHLYTGDIATMQTLVDGVAKDEPDVVAASIVDQDGKVWVRRGDDVGPADFARAAQWSLDAQGGHMRLIVPITSTPLHVDDFTVAPLASGGDGETRSAPLGHVVMRISLRGLNKERDRMLLLGVAAFLGALLVGGGLAIVLARSVTEPLGSIIAMVDRIGRGELNARVDLKPDCVLSPLVQGINHMAANVAMTQAELQQRIDEATLELQRQKHAAEREARIDPLTGLDNRRAFLERSERDVHRAGRYGTPVALIMLDLDHFKAINDTYGHPVGDRVLVELAAVLTKSMREVDIVGRLGGEEFAILMPDTNAEAAMQAAERLNQAVAAMAVEVEGQTIACTASCGISAMGVGDGSIHDLLQRADRALYLAKQRGRNRVELFEARAGG
jgi:diguanylate cyclase (GGDEF)-like protein